MDSFSIWFYRYFTTLFDFFLMANSRRRQTSALEQLIDELRANVSRELVGLVLLVVGGFLGITLLASPAAIGSGDANVAWVARMAGWTAPGLALSLVITGLVLILRERAGYWRAEALIGAEALIIGLAALSFALANAAVDWRTPLDGSDGGLIGWGVGGLLVAAAGQQMAILLAGGLVAAGCWLLAKYTPLLWLVQAFRQVVWPGVKRFWIYDFGFTIGRLRSRDRIVGVGESADVLPRVKSFVAAEGASPTEEMAGERQGAGAQVVDIETPVVQRGVADEPTKSPKASPKKSTTRMPKPLRKTDELPPVDLLSADSGQYGSADTEFMSDLIEDTLEDFNVPVKVVHIESGPTVTQYGVEPLYIERAGKKRKVSVRRITGLADDLALALAAKSVRIEAPVPGRPYVGIEVPNSTKTLVGLRGIMESPAMRKAGVLGLPLGRNTAGQAVTMDLAQAPHMLIAGATGAGKSVCINTIVAGLLMQHGPESLRFLMVDPKMVELPGYNGIPHLIGQVITDMEQVMGALTWLLLQMDDRYRLFREHGVRNVESYNAKVSKSRAKDAPEPLPYLVLIIDELADLMMTAADDIERQLCRLAQMARATGIHLIIATQRPSTDVVTGLIKANFPTRIAFAVTSQIDSRVILDTPGAERLLGRGDMLMMRSDESKLSRIQGCFVGDEEITAVTEWWKAQVGEDRPPVVSPWKTLMDRLDASEEEELLLEAEDALRGMESCSTSGLQRKLGIGYPKAARLMEQLEARGSVGPDLGGGRGREVLVGREEEGVEAEVI